MAYREIILNNNYLRLLDYDREKYYYRKTIPIHHGTFIIDVINNKLINISG